MSIIVRRLLESESNLANDFFNGVYKSNRSIENFRWEFLECPSGPAIYIVAIDDALKEGTKVVGIQCAIPIQLQDVKGNVVLTAKSEDTLVDPSYRGQKIFERMYELLFDECRTAGIQAIWGFTPAKKAFERIGFEIPFQSHQALLVTSPSKAYRYLASLNPKNRTSDKLKIAGLALLSKLRSIIKTRQPTLELVVERVDIKEKSDEYRSLLSNSNLFFLKMDREYVNWRIANNPFNNHYENYKFYSAGTLIADAMLNFRDAGVGYVEQILFSDKLSARVRRQIVLHIVKIMVPRVKLIRVLCFCSNAELRAQSELLRDAGFFLLHRGSYFVWKLTSQGQFRPDDIFLTRLFTQGNQ